MTMALKWVYRYSFLCDRQQRIVVNGMNLHVDLGPVLSGVPMSTVLGPLLLPWYINDTTNVIGSELKNLLTTVFAIVKSEIVRTVKTP